MYQFLALIRPRVSLAVACGSLFGAVYHSVVGGGTEPMRGVLAAIGAGLLCAGCSALNQVQERRFDRRMLRTRNRPVASGYFSPFMGAGVAAVLMLNGLLLFLLSGGWPLVWLGLAVPVIYNGLYTPLKPHTPMALLVGALSGALPPLTGWVGAGGSLLAPDMLAVTAIFYLWQVPHFWLLHEKHRDDYERAGFATLGSRLPRRLYRPLFGLWVGAYFVGLSSLAWVGRPMEAAPLATCVTLGVGGAALFALSRDRLAAVTAAVYGSLPLALLFFILNAS